MAYIRKTVCKVAGCPNYAEKGSQYCAEHQQLSHENKEHTTSKWKHMYNNRWRKARDLFLISHPWCERCLQNGDYVKADTVHHVIEHKGDQKLFWDRKNWQALCKNCHSSIHSPNMNKYKG